MYERLTALTSLAAAAILVTCAVAPLAGQAPREWAGRIFDSDFVNAVPESIDPCGERGEFHTFVCDGPMFHQPVGVVVGEIVERDGFVFTDLLRRFPEIAP